MDKVADKAALENELAFIAAWKDHPITKEVLQAAKDEQEDLVALLCNKPIINIETFFAHFEAVGHLRGLRSIPAMLNGKVEEIQQQITEL